MSDFDFSSILGPVIKAGGGIIGTALGTMIPIPGVGSAIGATIGGEAANILAQALGVDATPTAIQNAIETKSPAEIQAAMEEANAAAAAKWPAVAQIAIAHADVAKAQIAATAAQMQAELAAAQSLPPGWLRNGLIALNTIWRPLLALEFIMECAGFTMLMYWILSDIFFKVGDTDLNHLLALVPVMSILFVPYMLMRGGLMGYHMRQRTNEKIAETEASSSANPPIAGIDINGLVNGLIKVVANR